MFFHNLSLDWGKQHPIPSGEEESTEDMLFSFLPAGRQETACAPSGWNWHLPRRCRHRLPWFHRASPSTTLNEIRFINEYGYIDSSF
jgi:hypothetical protein